MKTPTPTPINMPSPNQPTMTDTIRPYYNAFAESAFDIEAAGGLYYEDFPR